MPGAAILDDPLPAEGVPVRLTTLPTAIVLEKPPEGNGLTPKAQFVCLRQLLCRKGFMLLNVLDGTDGYAIHIHVR
jgi:hypothetical protein